MVYIPDLYVATEVSGTAYTASLGYPITLINANPFRRQLSIASDAPGVVYIKLGSGCTTSDFSFRMAEGDLYELPLHAIYTGSISGRFSTASGSLMVTEWSGN